MGYYTNFELTVLDSQGEKTDYTVSDIIDQMFEQETGYSSFIEDVSESIKWYSHDEDMKRISLMYPDNVFKLKYHGEGNDYFDIDMGIKFYKNGIMYDQKAVIQLDETFYESYLS